MSEDFKVTVTPKVDSPEARLACKIFEKYLNSDQCKPLRKMADKWAEKKFIDFLIYGKEITTEDRYKFLEELKEKAK